MKVLFTDSLPFFLAHGGTQTLLDALMSELRQLGVEVEPVRWWDLEQTGDILHCMNRPVSVDYLRLAKDKGFKTVMTENLDQTASRTPTKLWLQRLVTQTLRRTIKGSSSRLGWGVYQELDAMIYVVEHEWEVAKYLFDAPPDRGYIIPHGLDAEALKALAEPQPEEDYLISIASITERKNTLILAEAALRAKVPIVFLGKPYAESDPYFLKFKELVDGQYVRYPGFVSSEEKHRLLRGARGFALLSQFESGCIALYEGAAAGLPLFLSDLPWATKVYRNARASRFVKWENREQLALSLGEFYRGAHRMPCMTFPIRSWREIAQQYLAIYENLLAR